MFVDGPHQGKVATSWLDPNEISKASHCCYLGIQGIQAANLQISALFPQTIFADRRWMWIQILYLEPLQICGYPLYIHGPFLQIRCRYIFCIHAGPYCWAPEKNQKL